MSTKIFKGTSLQECLERACVELGVSAESLKYEVIEEKKSLFKKTITISVEEVVCRTKNNNGTASVIDGQVIITDPKDDGQPASIAPGKGIKLKVNDEEIFGYKQVFAKDRIQYQFDEVKAERYLDISVSEDKMEVYISIDYKPQIKYTLMDCAGNQNITLEGKEHEKVNPPYYSYDEVMEQLKKLGIVYGILDNAIKDSIKGTKNNRVLIAKGEREINDTDDIIKYGFNLDNKKSIVDNGSYQSINYKDITVINSVKKGDIVAEKIKGTEGKNGKDVYGKVVLKKEGKKKRLLSGNGCEIVEENKVVAAIDGRPSIKNNVIHVNQVYEIIGDVDLKTGNVKFVGDVKIFGVVSEGMKIEAGNSIEIEKTVDNSEITAEGSISVRGNIMLSKIIAGGHDVIVLRRIQVMQEARNQLKSLVENVMEVKKFNLLGYNREDGEIIKLLMESKFKNVGKLCASIVKDYLYDDSSEIDEVIQVIRDKLIGMSPLGIKHFSELDYINEVLENKINVLKQNLALPVSINLNYCQDSNISSSGDVFVNGKGEYVSNITANNSITFTYEKGVARGGVLFAGNEIRCKIVGSTGGASTTLQVQNGHIWADTVYQGTKFVIGSREFMIDVPCKAVHAYLDGNGELTVEKLRL